MSIHYVKLFGLFTNTNDFLAAVEAASLANPMCENELTALGALNDAGEHELEIVCSSLVSACFGYLSLRYCHVYTSLDSAIYAQPFYIIIIFISGSFSDLTDKSVFF